MFLKMHIECETLDELKQHFDSIVENIVKENILEGTGTYYIEDNNCYGYHDVKIDV